MSTALLREPQSVRREEGSARASVVDASRLNGDLPLSHAERGAYMEHHRRRNAENIRRSREEGVVANPCPAPFCGVGPLDSPSRLMMHAFFEWASREFAAARGDRAISVLDIGCGTGWVTMEHLSRAGLRGRYVGLDISRHANWSDEPRGGFVPTHVLGRAESADIETHGPFDLVMSSTALEHIESPERAIERAGACCSPGAWQVHFVPGEASLPLYGPHGWRCFSPRCLRAIFPSGELYRLGGVASDWVHRRFVTPDTRAGAPHRRERFNGSYRLARAASWFMDRAMEPSGDNERGATMYGVLVRPGK